MVKASACQNILDNFMIQTLWEEFGDGPVLFQDYCALVNVLLEEWSKIPINTPLNFVEILPRGV